MRLNKTIATWIVMSAAMILCAGIAFRGFAAPQQGSKQAQPMGKGTAPADFPRGAEQIYMIKCWMCHNEFAKTGPSLKDLAKRPKLISGQPVNDKTVSEMIRNGSPRMPSYGYSLSDQQLADLVGYLLNGKCCPDPDNPPVNPQYRKPS